MKMEYYLIIALIVSLCIQLIHFLKYLPTLKFSKVNATLTSSIKNRSKQQILVEFELDGNKYNEICDVTGLGIDLTEKQVDVWFSPNKKGLCFACKPTMKFILKKNLRIAQYVLGAFIWLYICIIYFNSCWFYE